MFIEQAFICINCFILMGVIQQTVQYLAINCTFTLFNDLRMYFTSLINFIKNKLLAYDAGWVIHYSFLCSYESPMRRFPSHGVVESAPKAPTPLHFPPRYIPGLVTQTCFLLGSPVATPTLRPFEEMSQCQQGSYTQSIR